MAGAHLHDRVIGKDYPSFATDADIRAFEQIPFLPRLGRRFGEVRPVDFSGQQNQGSIQGFDES